MKGQKAESRNRDRIHHQERTSLERQIDRLTKLVRELQAENATLRQAADPAEVEDMREAIESHAKAEALAHEQARSANLKAAAWERRVERVEIEAAHLRNALDRAKSNGVTKPSNGHVPALSLRRYRAGTQLSTSPSPMEAAPMTMKVTIDLADLDAMVGRLGNAQRVAVTAMAAGILEDSQELVPVDTGDLKKSGKTFTRKTEAGQVEGVVRYGGKDAPYAPRVEHGDTKGSEFLRRPTMDSKKRLSEAAAAIRKAMDDSGS